MSVEAMSVESKVNFLASRIYLRHAIHCRDVSSRNKNRRSDKTVFVFFFYEISRNNKEDNTHVDRDDNTSLSEAVNIVSDSQVII